MTKTLIKGGNVFNPVSCEFAKRNILINKGKIESLNAGDVKADDVVDATEQYVSPGFIDLHCHVFNHPLFRASHLNADRIGIEQGVACVVDTGSAGAATIDAFKEFVIDTQETATFALVNIGSPGLPGIKGGHSGSHELVSLSGTVEAVQRHPDWIKGVKVLASSSHTGMLGIEAVKIGRKAAQLTNSPLMVHLGNAPPVIEEVLELMRPGDIITHAYHGKIGGVLGYRDKIIPEFKAAVERGVLVDIAHGRSSFSFATCEKALDQGMPIDTISSDLHMGNINRYVVSLARTMSKFRLLGLSLEEVIKAVTLSPAKAIGLQVHGFGDLTEGGPANITLFRESDKAVEVEDSEGEKKTTRHWIEPSTVFVDGKRFEASQTI